MGLRKFEITTRFYGNELKMDRREIFASTENKAKQYAEEEYRREGITEQILSMRIRELRG